MKLEDVRAAYAELSGKASEIVRQLGFAGIALIWVFRTEAVGQPRVPTMLLPAGLLIVIALSFDLLQYVVGALIWGSFNRKKEREGCPQDAEFTAPPRLNWPALFFFWGKVVLMAAAYVQLARFIRHTLG